jgi:hypothetical protein
MQLPNTLYDLKTGDTLEVLEQSSDGKFVIMTVEVDIPECEITASLINTEK